MLALSEEYTHDDWSEEGEALVATLEGGSWWWRWRLVGLCPRWGLCPMPMLGFRRGQQALLQGCKISQLTWSQRNTGRQLEKLLITWKVLEFWRQTSQADSLLLFAGWGNNNRFWADGRRTAGFRASLHTAGPQCGAWTGGQRRSLPKKIFEKQSPTLNPLTLTSTTNNVWPRRFPHRMQSSF